MAEGSTADRRERRKKWWTKNKKINPQGILQETPKDIESLTTSRESTSTGRRYILFVGNLSFETTREDVIKHFEKRGVPCIDFRLMTRKDDNKSKGCGFIELQNDKTYQNALKMNRTILNDRRIRIELSCGGGGNSKFRQEKIKKRNKVLTKSKVKKKLK